MRNLFIILLLGAVIGIIRVQAAIDLPTNSVIADVGDSLKQDSSHSDTNVVGYRWSEYSESAVQLYYPYRRIWWGNFSSSGSTFHNYRITMAATVLAFEAHDFNNYPHYVIVQSTDNGGDGYATRMLAFSNLVTAPLWHTNGVNAMVQLGGWCSSNTYTFLPQADPPEGLPLGSLYLDHVNAAKDTATAYGGVFIDTLTPLNLTWSNQFYLNNGVNLDILQSPDPKAGHIMSSGSYGESVPTSDTFITDTNISTGCIDWATGTPVWTNHCVFSSVSRSGNSLFFNRLDLRLPGAMDVPGTNIFGKVITNDCTKYFTLVDNSASNHYQFTQGLSNCPAGQYQIYHNGTLVATVSDTELTKPNGWNMYCLFKGRYWDKRSGVLALIRIKDGTDQVTLDPESAGFGESLVSYGSYSGSYWPTDQGDAFIQDMNNVKNPQIATNFNDIWAMAAPEQVAWEIRYIGVPQHMRIHVLADTYEKNPISSGSRHVSTFYNGNYPDLEAAARATAVDGDDRLLYKRRGTDNLFWRPKPIHVFRGELN